MKSWQRETTKILFIINMGLADYPLVGLALQHIDHRGPLLALAVLTHYAIRMHLAKELMDMLSK